MPQIPRHKPIIFIDFDRTLFATERFYEWLGEDRFSRILDILAGRISPPNFHSMLYDDAIPTLKLLGKSHRRVLLSFALNLKLQRMKIRESGVLPHLDDVLIVQGKKSAAARDYVARIGDTGWEHAFIDDSTEHVADMLTANPEFRSFIIDRDGILPRASLPPGAVEIRTFAEITGKL